MADLAPAVPIPVGVWLRHPVQTTLDAWRAIHASRDAALADRLDLRRAGGLALAAVVLWANNFVFSTDNFAHLGATLVVPRYRDLFGSAGWALARFVSYGLVPMFYARLVGLSWRELGLALPDVRAQVRATAALAVGIAPFVLLAATTARFQQKYPLYTLAGRSPLDFLVWELAYAGQFFGIELFYRGFLLELIRPVAGFYAVFIAAIPYCMIHFAKPPAEALGAIAAGLILGTLAIRRRSICAGLALHLLVAWGMDVLAIVQKR